MHEYSKKSTKALPSGFKDTIITFVTKIMVLLVSLGTQSCLAWLLEPEGRGSYAVCIIFASLLAMAFCFGVDVAVQYHVASNTLKVFEGVSVFVSYVFIGSILAISAGIILMQFQLPFFSKASQESFYLALVYVPILMLGTFFPLLLMGLRQFKWMGIFSVIQAFTQFIGVISSVWVFGLGVNGALIAIIIATFLAVLLNFIYLFRSYPMMLTRPSANHMRLVFLYGIRYYFGRLSVTLNMQMGTIILAFFVSSAEIGFFAVGTTLMSYVTVIPFALHNALMPRIAADNNGRPDLVAQMSRLTVIVCGAIIIAFLVLSRPIVSILFSPAFLPIVPLMWILGVGFFLRCVFIVIVPFFNGTNRPGVSSIATAAGVIVNVVLLLILLPLIGLSGAAWAMTLGYVTSFLVLAVMFYVMSGLSLVKICKYERKDFKLITDVLQRNRMRASIKSAEI